MPFAYDDDNAAFDAFNPTPLALPTTSSPLNAGRDSYAVWLDTRSRVVRLFNLPREPSTSLSYLFSATDRSPSPMSMSTSSSKQPVPISMWTLREECGGYSPGEEQSVWAVFKSHEDAQAFLHHSLPTTISITTALERDLEPFAKLRRFEIVSTSAPVSSYTPSPRSGPNKENLPLPPYLNVSQASLSQSPHSHASLNGNAAARVTPTTLQQTLLAQLQGQSQAHTFLRPSISSPELRSSHPTPSPQQHTQTHLTQIHPQTQNTHQAYTHSLSPSPYKLSSNPPEKPFVFRAGDWVCGDSSSHSHPDGCGAHNFGRNERCIGCGRANPHAHIFQAQGQDAMRSPRFTSRSPPLLLPGVGVGGLGGVSHSLPCSPVGIGFGGGAGSGRVSIGGAGMGIGMGIGRYQQQQQQQVSPYLSAPAPRNMNMNMNGSSSPRVGLSPGPGAGTFSSPRYNNPQPPPVAPNLNLPLTHVLTPSGSALAQNVRVRDVTVTSSPPVIMSWPDNEPLPHISQIRPSASMAQPAHHGHGHGILPPIMNTGNRGPIESQPGDWRCGVCGYLNWRRRKVCGTCYPFADGNLDGVNPTVQAERIASLVGLWARREEEEKERKRVEMLRGVGNGVAVGSEEDVWEVRVGRRMSPSWAAPAHVEAPFGGGGGGYPTYPARRTTYDGLLRTTTVPVNNGAFDISPHDSPSPTTTLGLGSPLSLSSSSTRTRTQTQPNPKPPASSFPLMMMETQSPTMSMTTMTTRSTSGSESSLSSPFWTSSFDADTNTNADEKHLDLGLGLDEHEHGHAPLLPSFLEEALSPKEEACELVKGNAREHVQFTSGAFEPFGRKRSSPERVVLEAGGGGNKAVGEEWNRSVNFDSIPSSESYINELENGLAGLTIRGRSNF